MQWYSINVDVSEFPRFVSNLLKGKKHEWVVIGIEKDGCVKRMWINKGDDNKCVALSCSIDDVIAFCKQLGAYSVFRVHNHPNSDPVHYTTLVASPADYESAKQCSAALCKEGFNWYDFVCSRGEFILFYSVISNSFSIDGSSASDIIDLYGITAEIDKSLLDEYNQYTKTSSVNHSSRELVKPIIGISISLLLILPLSFCHNPLAKRDETDNSAINNMEESFDKNDDYEQSELVSTTFSGSGVLLEMSETSELTEIVINDYYDSENGFHYSYDSDLDGYVVTSGPDVSNVVIPSEADGLQVVAIGGGAFDNHRNITQVTIPNTVVEIRDSAFEWCVELTEVTFQGEDTNLKTIGDCAFACCDIRNITIPEGVTSIGDEVFRSNQYLSSISLPDSLTSVGEYCFRWCNSLESIVIPPYVASLDENTFTSCSNLEEIRVPSGCVIDLGFDGFLFGCDAEIVEY